MTDITRNYLIGVGVARPLLSFEDDLDICECETGGKSHLIHKGACWPVPFEGQDLDSYEDILI